MDPAGWPAPWPGERAYHPLFFVANFVLIFKITIANITCLSEIAYLIVEQFRNYYDYFRNTSGLAGMDLLEISLLPLLSVALVHRLAFR